MSIINCKIEILCKYKKHKFNKLLFPNLQDLKKLFTNTSMLFKIFFNIKIVFFKDQFAFFLTRNTCPGFGIIFFLKSKFDRSFSNFFKKT